MLFIHLKENPLMPLTPVRYFSCALISGHLDMVLMQLTNRRYASLLAVSNRPRDILRSVPLSVRMGSGRGSHARRGTESPSLGRMSSELGRKRYRTCFRIPFPPPPRTFISSGSRHANSTML